VPDKLYCAQQTWSGPGLTTQPTTSSCHHHHSPTLKRTLFSASFTSLQCVAAVTLANRRGLLAFSYYPGAPAPSTVLMAVCFSRALQGSNVEVTCCTAQHDRQTQRSVTHPPAVYTTACLLDWLEIILAGSGRHGGMGGFDAKLQGFAISPDDIQICLRDDGTEWLLVRPQLALKPSVLKRPCQPFGRSCIQLCSRRQS
jgi:hypothetical protein